MPLPSEVIPILGPVTAALIAGGITFVITVLTKEQKTSEFRQTWIDALRADIAEFVSTAQMIGYVVTSMKSSGTDEPTIAKFLYDQHKDFIVLHQCRYRIKLRLNPKEHSDLTEKIDRLVSKPPLDMDDEFIGTAVQAIIEAGQSVLKAEWQRVKRGETIFRWTKRASLFILIAAAVGGIIFMSGHFSVIYVP